MSIHAWSPRDTSSFSQMHFVLPPRYCWSWYSATCLPHSQSRYLLWCRLWGCRATRHSKFGYYVFLGSNIIYIGCQNARQSSLARMLKLNIEVWLTLLLKHHGLIIFLENFIFRLLKPRLSTVIIWVLCRCLQILFNTNAPNILRLIFTLSVTKSSLEIFTFHMSPLHLSMMTSSPKASLLLCLLTSDPV